ncbi:hypothetical protein HJFPF1_00734 [Paramyrothecium foliicola]|nr:hypothetical protein HJFPF1_00734 [Paramyrothecium foliicola]
MASETWKAAPSIPAAAVEGLIVTIEWALFAYNGKALHTDTPGARHANRMVLNPRAGSRWRD